MFVKFWHQEKYVFLKLFFDLHISSFRMVVNVLLRENNVKQQEIILNANFYASEH